MMLRETQSWYDRRLENGQAVYCLSDTTNAVSAGPVRKAQVDVQIAESREYPPPPSRIGITFIDDEETSTATLERWRGVSSTAVFSETELRFVLVEDLEMPISEDQIIADLLVDPVVNDRLATALRNIANARLYTPLVEPAW